LNVGIVGYWRDAGTAYLPSPAEWAVGLGVIAAAALVFLAVVENFSIFDQTRRKTDTALEGFASSFDAFSRVWNMALSSSLHRVSLIAVFVLPLAWLTLYPPYQDREGRDPAVQPPLGLDAARTTLRIDGNRAGVFTDFQHTAHQQRLGGESACRTCHHVSLPGDNSTPCSRCHRDLIRSTDLFDHLGHMTAVAAREKLSGIRPENRSCRVCHAEGAAKAAASAKACYDCHREDMRLPDLSETERLELGRASGYQSAMHSTCITCHREKAADPKLAHLPECGTCHQSLRSRPALVAGDGSPAPHLTVSRR
jgi:hypothetical protein